MNKTDKECLVNKLREDIIGSDFIAITRNQGLKVSDVTGLRQKIFSCDESNYCVVKNTFMRLIAKGTDIEALIEYFNGPTAVAYGRDPVNIAKTLVEFAQDNEKLTLVAGFMAGRILSDADIKNLSKMPSLIELQAQIVQFIQAAAGFLVRQIQAPAMHIFRILTQLSEKEA